MCPSWCNGRGLVHVRGQEALWESQHPVVMNMFRSKCTDLSQRCALRRPHDVKHENLTLLLEHRARYEIVQPFAMLR